jgi:hypothetical protein
MPGCEQATGTNELNQSVWLNVELSRFDANATSWQFMHSKQNHLAGARASGCASTPAPSMALRHANPTNSTKARYKTVVLVSPFTSDSYIMDRGFSRSDGSAVYFNLYSFRLVSMGQTSASPNRATINFFSFQY